MYCFSCFGEAHGDFFTRNNLFILNFTLKKKLIVTRSFFLRCFTLQVVQELKGALFPWVGEVPGGIFGNHSFVCSCVVQQNVRVVCLFNTFSLFPGCSQTCIPLGGGARALGMLQDRCHHLSPLWAGSPRGSLAGSLWCCRVN